MIESYTDKQLNMDLNDVNCIPIQPNKPYSNNIEKKYGRIKIIQMNKNLKEVYSSYSSTNFRVINFEIPDSNGLKYPMISNSPDSYIHLNPESFPNNLRKNVSKIDIYRPLNERDQIKKNISEIRCKTEMKNKLVRPMRNNKYQKQSFEQNSILPL